MADDNTGGDAGANDAAQATQEATDAQTTTDAAGQQTQTEPASTAAPDWREGLDGELKEFAAKNLPTAHDAVKLAYSLRGEMSGRIKLPGKDAKPEEVSAFRKALGVPEKPDEYKFPDPPQGKELSDEDKAVRAKIAAVMHEENVPGAVSEKLAALVTELGAAQEAEWDRIARKGREDNEAALKKEWGNEFDKNSNAMTRAVAEFGGDELTAFANEKYIDGVKLGDHPAFLKAWAKVGLRMAERGFIGAVEPGTQTLLDEKARILRDNPPGSDKYKNAEVQKRLGEINEQLYGGEPIVGAQGRAV